ncbi:Fe-S cluster assembly ATPase SufC [Calditrichota bacterium]
MLKIENLHVSIQGTPILKDFNLEIPDGEVHALMGPNGSGKSTLASTLMGHPAYEVIKGSANFNGVELLELDPDERARLGIFLAFQYPHEVPGVGMKDFLRTASLAVNKDDFSLAGFMDKLDEAVETLQMDKSYLTRALNEGFSGGEKKRAEILQMLMLKPKLAILDETDSGLDIDALRIVAGGVKTLRSESFSALVITHYQRILNYLEPDVVHIMHQGKIIETGGKDLAKQLEQTGYENLKEDKALLG